MDVIVNRLDLVEVDQDFVTTICKEIQGIKSTIHGETSTPPSINDQVIQQIRCKLQVSEWNAHMANILPKCLTISQVQKKMDKLRSETNRVKLREKMSCMKGEEFETAQQIFQAIEEGKLEVFKNLMEMKVRDWNFQLEEYGKMTPLLWAVLHGQTRIVGAIREHALANGSTEAMFMTFDKFGFRIMNVAVFAYLILSKSKHDNLKGMFKDLLDWERQSKAYLGYMDSRLRKKYTPCKIYYSIEDDPTRYFVDDLGHLGYYMTPLHLATWFAPTQVAIQIIEWRIKGLERSTGNGHTVFHLSAWKGRHEILQWLLQHAQRNHISLSIGNHFSNDGQSPLHLAVLSQNEECVKILLGIEANSMMKNWEMFTPMKIATILYAESPSTMKKEDLKRFGVTSFDTKSLGLTCDVGNVSVQNFTRDGIHSIDRIKDSNALKNIISMFDVLDPEALQRERQVYVDAANAILVGAALIASASFGAWLQPPLGYMEYYSNEFLVTQSAAPPETYQSFVAIKQHWIIQLFWILNSLSFFSSIATVIAGADAALPEKDLTLREAMKRVRHGVIWASYFLLLSIVCIIGTFCTIGFAILPPIPKYRVNMYCTMVVGLALCGVALKRLFWKLRMS